MPAPTTIAGILGIEDSDTILVNQVGQEVVYDAIGEYTTRLNTSLDRIIGLFVEATTTKHSWKYYLPGNRELQTQGGLARPGEQKFRASYDVALPIFQYGDALGGNFIDMAYMTIAGVDRNVGDIRMAARKLLRKEILKAIFNNTSFTHDDPVWGDLTVLTLANGDTVYYPPLPGTDDLATADHYAEAGYLVSAISNTNDPILWHAEKLAARFPDELDGLVFCSSNVAAKVKALDAFMEVGDPRVTSGGLADRLNNLPGGVPGKVVGRMHETWVVEWADVPSNYTTSLAPSYEKPLQRRVDPPATGLPSELTLIKNSDLHPLEKSEWMWRFGVAVVNRMNGFVLEVAAGGSYTVPTSLAR